MLKGLDLVLCRVEMGVIRYPTLLSGSRQDAVAGMKLLEPKVEQGKSIHSRRRAPLQIP